MKKYLYLMLFALSVDALAQEPIWVSGSSLISFENPLDSTFLISDSSDIWYIGQPQKDNLFLPNNLPFLGVNGVFTDTSQYYDNNSMGWIQFRLIFVLQDYYIFEFYHAYDFETHRDGGIIETSWDNGKTWNNLLYDNRIYNESFEGTLYNDYDTIAAFNNQPGFTGFKANQVFRQEFKWVNYDLEFDTLLLRFTFASDSNNAFNEGWLLDDFRFNGGLVPIEFTSPSSDLLLHPNPVSDVLNLLGDLENISKICLFNAVGNILLTKENNLNSPINVNSLNPGVYFLTMEYITGEVTTINFQKL